MTSKDLKEKTQYREQFSFLMLKLIRYERKSDTPTIEEIADILGLSYDHCRKIIAGERTLRDEDIPRWYRACGKPIELLRHIVRSCDHHADVIRLDRTLEKHSMSDEILEINVLLGQLVEVIQDAVADGIIDIDESKKIRDKAMDIVSELFAVIKTAQKKVKK